MYIFLNWFFCIITSLLLGLIIWRYRFLIIKPSIIVIVFFHIQIQWAATFQADYIGQFLPRPYTFLLLAQVFPLLGLIISFFTMHKKTIKVYSKITRDTIWTLDIKSRALIFLFVLIVVIVFIYLSFVPLSRTGIYAILLDPMQSTSARESSLKLLDSALLKYGFSLLKTVLAPLLSILTIIFFIQSIKNKKMFRSLWAIFIFLFTLIAVLLPGARMPGGLLILTVIYSIFIIKKMPIRPAYIIFSFLLVIILPVLMTLFREGLEFDMVTFFDYMTGGIFKRVFVVPMETGLWHVHYGQEVGFVGAAGIPKLAELMAIEPINIANIIYLKYTPYRIFSGLANTSFVFGYYTSFGIGSLVFSFLGLWALDLAILVFYKIRNNAILLAAVASIAMSSLGFISSMYTTVLLSNGFIFILIFALILDRLYNLSLANRLPDCQKG
jgi:hypothetical protein